MIFCKLRQVSSRASIVNYAYGLGATLKLLILWSKSINAGSRTKYGDFLDRVATHRVGKILRVESGRLLGDRQIEILDLTELLLHGKQTVLAGLRIGTQLLPASQHVLVVLQGCGQLSDPS